MQNFEDQKTSGLYVAGEMREISKIHLWSLLLYALGIVLINMDKAKEAIFRDDKEIKETLKRLEDQSKRMLAAQKTKK